MMNKLALLVGSLLFAVLGVTGCGGGDTNEGSQATPGGGLLGAGAPPPLTTASPAPIKFGDEIVLKSAYWRQYLSAQTGNSVEQALYPLKWEKWTITDRDHPGSQEPVKFNDNIRLQSVAKGSWLSAQDNNAVQQASAPQDWEVWQFRDPANPTATGTVTQAATAVLYNLHWGTFASARQGTGVAQASAANTWEHWLVLPKDYVRKPLDKAIHYGDVITARGAFRTYLSAQDGARVELADHPEAWEKWEIVNRQQWGSTAPVQLNDPVALYAVDKGRYLSAQDNANTKQVEEVQAWEQWTIIDPNGLTGPVQAIDTVAFASSRGTYLSAQQTVAQHVSPLGPWEKWVIAPDGYFSNWMAREAAAPDSNFASKPLREITFPASHDAGTWSLKSEISNDGEEIAKKLKPLLDTYNTAMNLFLGSIVKVTIAGYTIDLGAGVADVLALDGVNASYDTLKALSQATRRTVAQQLSDGVRWLDLRIDLRKGGGAYTYHFLTAAEMEGMLDDVAAFLAGTSGEIVVLEMSHFAGDKLSIDKYDKFANMVDNKLKDYMVQWTSGRTDPLLASKYDDLVPADQDGKRKSKVIVLMDSWGYPPDAPNVHERGYWTYDDLGFDNPSSHCSQDDPKKVRTGCYANRSVLANMLADQQQKFQNRDTTRPFALYMTLTGSPSELGVRWTSGTAARWIDHAYENMWRYLPEWLKSIGGVHTFARDLISTTVNWAFSQAGMTLFGSDDWNSLWDLSQKVDPDMHTTLETQFQSSGNAFNNISLIYADFVDTTFLVETAIRYSRMAARPASAASAAASAPAN